jgi:hypothetical protein
MIRLHSRLKPLPTSLVQTVIILETFHGTDAYTHMHIYTPGSNNKTTFI